MLDQLTIGVAKHWQKFSQWFEFWKQVAMLSSRCLDYLFRKNTISSFLDFQLEKKSPLKIRPDKKYTLGNRYTQPNFFALFDLVTFLVERAGAEERKLSHDDLLILTEHSFLDRIISDKN